MIDDEYPGEQASSQDYHEDHTKLFLNLVILWVF